MKLGSTFNKTSISILMLALITSLSACNKEKSEDFPSQLCDKSLLLKMSWWCHTLDGVTLLDNYGKYATALNFLPS